jgi:PAS domain S-box-containing protein
LTTDTLAAAQHASLGTFLRWLLGIAGTFALGFAGAAAILQRGVLLPAAGLVCLVFLAALRATYLTEHGRVRAAATLVGYTLLGHAIAQAYILPFAALAFTVSILLAVALVLPYLDGRPLRLFLGAAVACSFVVPLVAAVSPLQEALPFAVRTEIAVAVVPAVTFLVTVLLWRYSTRTRELLEAQAAARQAAETAAAAARTARDQVAVILKAVAEGITVQDPAGRLVYANDAAARLSGFDSAASMLKATGPDIVANFELLGDSGEILPLDNLPGRIALAQGARSERVLRFRNKRSGAEQWAVVSAEPVFGADGRPELAVNVFRDLTDHKRSEDAWRFLAEASVLLGSSLDFQTTLASVARLAVPHIADWCSVDLLTPRGIEQLAIAHVDPRKTELARELRRRWPPKLDSPRGVGYTLRTGRAQIVDISPELLRSALPDPEQLRIAEQLHLRSAMTVPLTVGERPVGALTFIGAESGRHYGPTDLLLAQEIARRASLAIENARHYTDAREALKVRDTFLSIASHELKTPLTSLLLWVSGLRHLATNGRDGAGAQKLEDRLSRIEAQTQYLGMLVDQLLEVSRIAGGRLVLSPGPADLVGVARGVVDRFQLQAQRQACALTLAGDGTAQGEWDPVRLDEILSNLVANAIKYGAGKPVRVQVEDAATEVKITVSDEGQGIAPEDQARIFEQFERAAPANLGGLGLGLWIVRHLVEAHGGSIHLQSDLGAGSQFTVRLPKQPASAEQSTDRLS